MNKVYSLVLIFVALMIVSLASFADENNSNTIAACTTEGNTYPIVSPEYGYGCCSGLTSISTATANSDGTCNMSVGAGLCSNCGNGICEQWENKCNCEKDCSTPVACTLEWAPVCGTDGVTYGNECSAKAAGATISYKGECTTKISEEVKCYFANSTTDQKCYANTGANCYGKESCSTKVEYYKGKTIEWKSSCGGYATTTMDGSSEYIKFDCSSTQPACACTREYNPVCGADGKTYGNECTAKCANVEKLFSGECGPMCGGIAGIQCPEESECVYPEDSDIIADAAGYCKKSSDSCPSYSTPYCPDGEIKSSTDERGCKKPYCLRSEKKYRYASWTCSDGSVHKEGSSSSCKTESTWKEYARQSCMKISCPNSEKVSEQVKCVFNNSTSQQKCYASEGQSCATENTGGNCVVDVLGIKGTSLTWKSSCGGYAYTKIDGEYEYATFECTAAPTEIVSEEVKCLFNNSTAEQECTAYDGFGNLVSCKGTESCVTYVKGNKGSSVTWKSSCGGYAYTTIDGVVEYAQFDCPQTIIVDQNFTVDYNVDISTNSSSKSGISPITGNPTLTTTISNTSTATSGSTTTSVATPINYGGEGTCSGYVTDFKVYEECSTSSVQTCRMQNYDEIRDLKEKCLEQKGQISPMFDEQGCQYYSCSLTIEGSCIDLNSIPEEKYASCEENGGKMKIKTSDNGCVTFVECIGQNKEDSNKIKVPDQTKLLELALKLETLNIEFDKLIDKVKAIADYYSQKGDTNNAQKYNDAIGILQSAKLKVDEIKGYIKTNLTTFNEEDAKKVREDIKYLKEEILKQVLLKLLE